MAQTHQLLYAPAQAAPAIPVTGRTDVALGARQSVADLDMIVGAVIGRAQAVDQPDRLPGSYFAYMAIEAYRRMVRASVDRLSALAERGPSLSFHA